MQPDALIIQDPTLLHQVDLFSGLTTTGYILINSTRSFADLGHRRIRRAASSATRLCTVPATEIAIKHVGRPLPNVPLLARLRRDQRRSQARIGVRRRSARSSPARWPRPTSPPPREAYDIREDRAQEALHA